MRIANVEIVPNTEGKAVRITYNYFFIFNVTRMFFFDGFLWRTMVDGDYASKVRVQIETWKIQQRIANRKYL